MENIKIKVMNKKENSISDSARLKSVSTAMVGFPGAYCPSSGSH
jgi:hypothetical protein